jgi:hypothetical protein
VDHKLVLGSALVGLGAAVLVTKAVTGRAIGGALEVVVAVDVLVGGLILALDSKSGKQAARRLTR